MKNTILALFAFSLLGNTALAQRSEMLPMESNPVLTRFVAQHHDADLRFACPQQTLALPFFDDFAYAGPYPDCNRWVDQGVYVNNTYAIHPPSVGAATFDGLDPRGLPYDPTNTGSTPADTMTSQMIDLSGYPEVYMYYEFQAQGNGNAPDGPDSLVLEFKNSNGSWITIYQYLKFQDAPDPRTFYGEYIAINQAQFLHSGFQFRFRNYATVTGNNDHWNVDYVYLDDSPLSFAPTGKPYVQDVAFTERPLTVLNQYSAIPLTHFKTNPQGLLSGAFHFDTYNHFDLDKKLNKSIIVKEATSNTTLLSSGVFSLADAVPGENGYDATAGFTFANGYDHTFWANYAGENAMLQVAQQYTIDATTEAPDFVANNSESRLFPLDNYYAYDDGSSEGRIRITGYGSMIAVEYTSMIADTLRGFYVHLPYVERAAADNNTIVAFNVWLDTLSPAARVLSDIGIRPQDLDYEQYVDSLNGWWRYAYTSPIAVEAGQKFYIGWENQSDFNGELRVGLDVNTPGAITKSKQNGQGNWEPHDTTIVGAVMMRPILGSHPIYISSVEHIENQAASFDITPNPATGTAYLRLQNAPAAAETLEVVNALGQSVYRGPFAGQLNVSSFAPGVYTLVVYGDGYRMMNRMVVE